MADFESRINELEKRCDWLQHQLASLEKSVQDDVTRSDTVLTRIERRLDKLEDTARHM